jgi:hypothetical protein
MFGVKQLIEILGGQLDLTSSCWIWSQRLLSKGKHQDIQFFGGELTMINKGEHFLDLTEDFLSEFFVATNQIEILKVRIAVKLR